MNGANYREILDENGLQMTDVHKHIIYITNGNKLGSCHVYPQHVYISLSSYDTGLVFELSYIPAVVHVFRNLEVPFHSLLRGSYQESR